MGTGFLEELKENQLDALRAELQRMEEQLLQPGVRENPAEAGLLLDASFTEIGSSGRVYSRADALEALSREPVGKITIADFRIAILSSDVAQATYRAIHLNEPTGQKLTSLRSSIWKHTSAGWRILFHQGTSVRE